MDPERRPREQGRGDDQRRRGQKSPGTSIVSGDSRSTGHTLACRGLDCTRAPCICRSH